MGVRIALLLVLPVAAAAIGVALFAERAERRRVEAPPVELPRPAAPEESKVNEPLRVIEETHAPDQYWDEGSWTPEQHRHQKAIENLEYSDEAVEAKEEARRFSGYVSWAPTDYRAQDAEEALPPLIALLDVDDTEVAQGAAYAIKRMGKRAAFAADELRKHVDSRHSMVQYYLKQVLVAIERG